MLGQLLSHLLDLVETVSCQLPGANRAAIGKRRSCTEIAANQLLGDAEQLRVLASCQEEGTGCSARNPALVIDSGPITRWDWLVGGPDRGPASRINWLPQPATGVARFR